MRVERGRARTAVCAVLLVAASCGRPAALLSPRGDGGWTAAQRGDQLWRLSRRAGVAFASSSQRARVAGTKASRLDLATALAMASRSNRRIAAAEHEIEAAAERVAEARGGLLPETTGSGRYSWYTDPQTTAVHLPPGLVPPGAAPPSIRIRDQQFGVVNGTITLPLDVSGVARHALSAAQAGFRAEEARLWATTLGEHLAVVHAYFELLEAERLRQVTEQTIAVDRAQLADARARLQNGRLTKNELLVVQVALRNAEEELVQRDLAIHRARWALNQAIGAEVDAPTEPADVAGRPVVPAVDEALAVSHDNNPFLRLLLEEQQRLEESERSLERSRFPRLAGGGAVDYSTSSLVRPQTIGSGFVGFTWDFGTDGRREAEIAQAKIAARENRVAIERQLRELEASIRTAQLAAAERIAALDAAEAAVGQAEENLRIRRQQFEAGRATSEDVLDAERLLSAQRATLASALYEAHIRRAELRQLMGVRLDDAAAAPQPKRRTP